MKTVAYPDLVRSLVSSAERSYKRFNDRATFGGPSLYYHKLALQAAHESHDAFAQAAYAMLVSWGMHRMGKGGAKMGNFEPFHASIIGQWPRLQALRGKKPGDLTEVDWNNLKEAFFGIKIMATNTILVSNSKILAHALPELVVPIDRNYTLRYVFKNTTITNDPSWQWRIFRELHEQLFFPIAASKEFRRLSQRWIDESEQFPWNTSLLKLVDSCIIGATPEKKKAAGD